ncbi:hypothetical protein [Variovorax boronicumulans]|uniref:hypothetical protein n=1 Tax=Variovorax boronicumulans TaxID=436515 RepID=UPI0012FE6FAD|nr:hypothetical protein [Variovorax boronicumulans]
MVEISLVMVLIFNNILSERSRDCMFSERGSVQVDFFVKGFCSRHEVSSAGRKRDEVKEIAIAKKAGTRKAGQSQLASSGISSNAPASGIRS